MQCAGVDGQVVVEAPEQDGVTLAGLHLEIGGGTARQITRMTQRTWVGGVGGEVAVSECGRRGRSGRRGTGVFRGWLLQVTLDLWVAETGCWGRGLVRLLRRGQVNHTLPITHHTSPHV